MKRLIAGLLILSIGCVSLIAIVGWLLVRPVPVHFGEPPADLKAQAVEFSTDTGATIKAWWCPSASRHATILLLPAVRANRLSMLPRGRFLYAAGYSVLLPDFEATGESKGDRVTFGWNERHDVLAAVQYLRTIRPEDRIAVIGTSLGGAPALLATPPLTIDGLVIESVYTTVVDATRNRLRKYLGPLRAAGALLLLMQLKPRLGIAVDDLRPLDHVAMVKCPLLIIGGEKDRNTTLENTKSMYRAAQPGTALWIVPGVDHVDLYHAAPAEYERRVLRFLQERIMASTDSRPTGF